MGTVPTILTWNNGDQPNFDDMNLYMRDVLTFLMNPPMVRMRKTVSQTMATGVNQPINWDYVEVESENFWDATAPTRIKPSTPGWYFGSAEISFDNNANGLRQMDINKNGSRIIRVKSSAFTSVDTTFGGVTFIEQFNGTTDYIELIAFQDSGVTLSTKTATDEQPTIALYFIAAL